ncbi:MAG: 50S ribosomal protein L6 [Candidatus Marinimicrobia bacterium]|nr:50S ribosomal protein L6 [Candidatus Neomarinimicrobiota bacterium]
MSKIGKKSITIPDGVKVDIKGSLVSVEGKLGKLSRSFKDEFKIETEGNQLTVIRPTDTKNDKAYHGLMRQLIANMISGVSQGFSKELHINGVGFSAEMKGNSLMLNMGYSHPYLITPSNDLKIEIPANLKIKVSGIDKQKVGQLAARIREVYPPEPYKGKGIKYADELITRKAGKKVGQ